MFLNCCSRALDRGAKLITIHKEANHSVVHQHGFGPPGAKARPALTAQYLGIFREAQ